MSLIAKLQELLDADGLLLPADDLARYTQEPRGRYQGRPLAVARPRNAGQLAALVRCCGGQGVAMVAQGGRTGLVGGAAVTEDERQLIISLERMNSIRVVDVADASMVVEAGCTLAQVQRAAMDHDLVYPVSLASEGSATIGGTIATNAGGNLTIRHGNSRRQVLGLEVVLADGRVHSDLAPLRKDNSGYDLKQWFIGSEGTLGIITAATLALQPAARQSVTAMVAVASLDSGLALLARLRDGLGETLSACEFMPRLAIDYVLDYLPQARDPFDRTHPWYIVIQADTSVAGDWLEPSALAILDRAMNDGLANDAVVADSQARANALWRLRESISAAQQTGGVSLKHDIAVPVGRIPEFVERATAELEQAVPGIRPCLFGHLGDGNLHFNLSQPQAMSADKFRACELLCNRIVFDLVRQYHGSIAAEHGIGQLRRDELANGQPLKVELMKQIKTALDPDN
ncbi:MAG: FAD-binding oxidoreductase, partial [Wenzhouxiangella sp.]